MAFNTDNPGKSKVIVLQIVYTAYPFNMIKITSI
ncbi:hypothetical protein MNBD_GAMMA09-2849 [hydrothermal vent metagenome]|uniref:Uncharacterized protein n=1 Tax=hydrothermal vent metagenome TaxID=652676 RepID=A0A3B0YCJ0_9ZZZZ